MVVVEVFSQEDGDRAQVEVQGVFPRVRRRVTAGSGRTLVKGPRS